MTNLNSDVLAKMMAEFEAKNGPVETIPVSFGESAKSIRTFREESYAQVQEAKARKESRAKVVRSRREPKPRKVVLSEATIERNKRIEKMAALLGVTSEQLNEAAKAAQMQLRSYTKKGEKQ